MPIETAARRSRAQPAYTPSGGTRRSWRDVEIRGREPELPAAAVPADDGPLDLGRTAEQRRRPLRLAGVQELPHATRGDVLDERHPPHVEAEPREQVEIAFAPATEPERLPRGDRLGSDPAEHLLGELLRRQRSELLVEPEHEDVLDSGVREQLEPALERREELDVAAEHGPGMRIERHDARAQPGPPRRVDHPQVAPVDAVERPDRSGRAAQAAARPAHARRSRSQPRARRLHSRQHLGLRQKPFGRERVRRDSVVHRERPDLAFAAASCSARRARSRATGRTFRS